MDLSSYRRGRRLKGHPFKGTRSDLRAEASRFVEEGIRK